MRSLVLMIQRRLQRVQMMNNPEFMRMASEGMKNIRFEDFKAAADQMKNVSPEQLADFTAHMSRASPEELASMRARTEAQLSYEVQGALTLKNQGNQLHGIGRYSEAAEKYARAKNNLAEFSSQEAASLRLTCSLNLMSCYLKTQQYHQAISEGSEVLQGDPRNLKALYRRGQAYKELGKFKLAFKDLSEAADLSPDDETVAETLRQVKEELELYGQGEDENTTGPVIEEITEEAAEKFTLRSSERLRESNPSKTGISDRGDQARIGESSQRGPSLPDDQTFAESLNILKQNPDMIRNMHSLMENVDPEQIAALSGGGMNSEMARFAADMVKQMTPSDLERMVEVANSMRSQGSSGVRLGSRTATDMLADNNSPSLAPGSINENLQRSRSNQEDDPGELLQQPDSFTSGSSMPTIPNITPEMQDQMRKQMRDPAMKQMMATFMKSMSPESMASMSEQMGMKLTPEQAAEAHKAMANLNPDQLDRLMLWAERAQTVTQQIGRAKNWLLGRPGLILAILMLLVAIILHYFGYIGQ
ncbi:hypothetical protein O6H91_06G087600 [Diphasiastrum complanatum]|uniref:Uncharacterized protein n=1 Tax=Diphasiastrum complanatum TaxID=34168 RepID=A0ACC2DFU0_DIPCM|nr:hypothetical protein O6H91_06G087600 [Diphasiastrum complanatum]